MNYYNPYFNTLPYYGNVTNGLSKAIKPGIFGRLLGGNINFSSILTGTQKTLNIVNQTIPLIKQVRPMVHNAKTMFKVMNEFKKVDTKPTNKEPNYSNNIEENKENINSNNDYGPTFFLV